MWSFRETCIDRTRAMQLDDLENIALMVAQGLHDCTRTQRNFPGLNRQFRLQFVGWGDGGTLTSDVGVRSSSQPTDLEIGNTQSVLDGNPDPFIEASLKQGL